MSPALSILLPAYNAADTLPACLASIARQTVRDWECIVVDDGSTDGTLACARAAAARDARFVVVAAPHRGLVGALTTGLTHCLAPVTARMDADDVMHRERLAAQLRALDDAPALAAVGCHVRIIPRAGLRDGLRDYERWLRTVDSPARVRAEAFVECPVVHPTLAIRSEVLRRFAYRDQPWPEDYDLILRLLAEGHEVGVVPRRLLCWRDRPTRLTRTGPNYRLANITACKAAFLAATFLKHADDYVLWGYGQTGRALARALRTHGKRFSHVIEVHQRRLGQTIQGAPVLPVEALPTLRDRPLVASVAGAHPRQLIRDELNRCGFIETHDYVCAA